MNDERSSTQRLQTNTINHQNLLNRLGNFSNACVYSGHFGHSGFIGFVVTLFVVVVVVAFVVFLTSSLYIPSNNLINISFFFWFVWIHYDNWFSRWVKKNKASIFLFTSPNWNVHAHSISNQSFIVSSREEISLTSDLSKPPEPYLW